MDFNIAHAWLALLIQGMVSTYGDYTFHVHVLQCPVVDMYWVAIGGIHTLDLCLFSSGFQSYSVSCGIEVLSLVFNPILSL